MVNRQNKEMKNCLKNLNVFFLYCLRETIEKKKKTFINIKN